MGGGCRRRWEVGEGEDGRQVKERMGGGCGRRWGVGKREDESISNIYQSDGLNGQSIGHSSLVPLVVRSCQQQHSEGGGKGDINTARV